MHIKSVLEEIGYEIKDYGYYYSTRAVYRDGNDPTSLVIYPNGLCVDFVTAEKFSVEMLVARTLGLKTKEQAQQYLTKKSCFVGADVHFNPVILTLKTYPLDTLKLLLPDHSYWVKRGIGEKTVVQFKGGVCRQGRLKNRYVIPILRQASKDFEIIGFTGRALNPKENKRWLHFGSKSFWVYPNFLNDKIIREKKSVILVEGIGDLLSLFEAGFNNSLSLFGVEMCKALILYLIRVCPEKIIIALNNDSGKSEAGNRASEKIKNKLTNYFDERRIQICLPQGHKDWNEVLMNKGVYELQKQFENYL